MTWTALEWKRFYAAERASLGERGLDELCERASALPLTAGGAIVFPHTKLADSGVLVASAALSVVCAGHSEVLALGVLHGPRAEDAGLVRRARAGDSQARDVLRRVHGPGVAEDRGSWSAEFSLDNFEALLETAARRKRKRCPRVIARYPFLTGDEPGSLPGLDELQRQLARGCALVATTDPLHHGAGYGTPPDARQRRVAPQTLEFARARVGEQFALLVRHEFAAFSKLADAVHSDFRDAGPVLALLMHRPSAYCIHALELVDYADALAAPQPTWVAAALGVFQPANAA